MSAREWAGGRVLWCHTHVVSARATARAGKDKGSKWLPLLPLRRQDVRATRALPPRDWSPVPGNISGGRAEVSGRRASFQVASSQIAASVKSHPSFVVILQENPLLKKITCLQLQFGRPCVITMTCAQLSIRAFFSPQVTFSNIRFGQLNMCFFQTIDITAKKTPTVPVPSCKQMTCRYI